MSNPVTPPPATDAPDAAQRPRLVTRARLVPLAVLLVLVVVAAGIGLLNDGKVTGDLPAAAASTPGDEPGRDDAGTRATAAEKAAQKVRKACTPGFNTKVKSEPWTGTRKKQSEAAYK